jgi:hypothetical protein
MNARSKILAQHVNISLRDHRVIAPSTAARRRLAYVVFRQCGPKLLVFSGVDTHLHLELLCGRTAAGEIVRRIEIALQRWLQPQVGFQHYCEPVRDQGHLRRAFFYILRQRERHGYDDDPIRTTMPAACQIFLAYAFSGVQPLLRSALAYLG